MVLTDKPFLLNFNGKVNRTINRTLLKIWCLSFSYKLNDDFFHKKISFCSNKRQKVLNFLWIKFRLTNFYTFSIGVWFGDNPKTFWPTTGFLAFFLCFSLTYNKLVAHHIKPILEGKSEFGKFCILCIFQELPSINWCLKI